MDAIDKQIMECQKLIKEYDDTVVTVQELNPYVHQTLLEIHGTDKISIILDSLKCYRNTLLLKINNLNALHSVMVSNTSASRASP